MSKSDSKEAVYSDAYEPQQLDLRHAFARSALGVKLSYVDWTLKDSAVDWWVLDQPKIQIKNHMLLPDLAAWKHEQLSVLPEQEIIEKLPGWIGEVLSSSAEENERVVKMPLYARLGIKNLWVVNPNLHTLQVYQLENQNWRLVASYKNNDTVSEAPFDDISFSLSNLWSC